jgi:hypothetical protein
MEQARKPESCCSVCIQIRPSLCDAVLISLLVLLLLPPPLQLKTDSGLSYFNVSYKYLSFSEREFVM